MYCKTCGNEINDAAEICPSCGVRVNMVKTTSRMTALILSFICVGLGQVYKGEVISGIMMFLFTCFFMGMGFVIPAAFAVMLFIWMVSMIDAYQTNDPHP